MAQAKATTVQLSSIGVGPATNYPVATSVSYNSTDFQSSSFTTTAAGMAGGLLSVNGISAGSTQYVYSPSGAKIAVLQGGQLVKGTVPLPGGGTAVYNASGFGYFRHKDWLGSSRLATNWDHTVYSKEAYAPFGETENNMEQTSSTGQADRSFTGQDQDTTSGIFDYLFRRYDPVAGRWLSPDPSGWGSVSQSNPQSLNRYAYVRNNPMSLTDPNGLDCIYFNSDGTQSGAPLIGDCKSETDSGYYVNGTVNSVSYNALTGNATVGYTPDPTDSDALLGVATLFGVTNPVSNNSSYTFTGTWNGDDASVAPTTLTSSPTPSTPYIPTIPKSAPNNNRGFCGGTFYFSGGETDFGIGGAMGGAITEQDSQEGRSAGVVGEGWYGEGLSVGAGTTKSLLGANSKESVLQGVFTFIGGNISGGPLAGFQAGFIGGNGWAGGYFEGHIGSYAFGHGSYVRNNCRAGG